MAQTAIKTPSDGLISGEVSIDVNGFKMPAFRSAPAGKTGLPVVLVAVAAGVVVGTASLVHDDDLPGGNLRTAVSLLRQRALNPAPIDLPLRNVRGLGYRFDAPISKA